MELGPAFARMSRYTASTTLALGVGLGAISASEAKFDLGVSSTNYLGQGSEGRQDSFSSLDLELDSKTKGDEIDSRAHVQGQIGLSDSDYRFVEFPEAYLATSKKLTGPFQFTAGRKLVHWSAADELWGSGAFQPRFRWDYLRPQQVGLLGLFTEVARGPVKFTAFYSPIFIPDRGAPLDFADGRIRSISPWVVNPPYETEILKRRVPVRYEARMPKTSEIIRQDSIGGQLAVGKSRGVWASSSYAYKPMNQLLMSYDANLSVGPADEANVALFPRVAYHHLAAFDVGYRGKQMEGSLSLIADIPRDFTPPLTRTSQQVAPFYVVSPTLRLNPFGRRDAGSMTLSYLRVIGEDPADTGILADGVTSEFDSRYPFKSAFLFSTQLPTWRRLSADLKLLVDLRNPGTIVSWYFTYAANRDWRLFLATDVLSSFSDEESSDGTDFIRRYRENDRVTGGVTYVF